MSAASTAATLQHLLEAEGAVIHAALQARALPSMGGGVGMILTQKLPPGSKLARFPFRSMITARKARFNLAMAEVALELHEEKTVNEEGKEDVFSVVPFTSRVWSEDEFEMQVHSRKVRTAINAKVEELEAALDSTETIVCYIVLMAALHGRWQTSTSGSTASGKTHSRSEADEEEASNFSRSRPGVLQYTHENRWMRTWIRALPVQYDNLLELVPQQNEASTPHNAGAAWRASPPFSTSPSSPVPPLPLKSAYMTTEGWLRSYVPLARFRAAALREQHSIEERYRKCCATLRSFRNMPVGEEAGQGSMPPSPPVDTAQREEQQDGQPTQPHASSLSTVTGHPEKSKSPAPSRHQNEPASDSNACTLGHFLWAFNTLMSRGFFFPEETWALMPFVDYFNYALDSNGTMYPQEDDPDDATTLTNTSLSMLNCALTPSSTARKAARRTGLRSARVGRGAIPLANYSTDECELVRPLHAAGEQVMLHYGAYSDMELLMWYGFTLRPSLLPTSHLTSAAAHASDEANDVVSLLPPGLAVCNDDETLLHTTRALRVLLPQIVRAETRAAYYSQHIQSPRTRIVRESADAEQRCQAVHDEADEGDYVTWAKALHRAYRLPLSPMADAEGNYSAAMRGQTWIDALFAAFLQVPPLTVASAEAASASHAAAASRVDGWMRRWIAERWPLFAETAFPHIAKDCGLGVFGLSPVLHAAITSSFWIPPKQEGMCTAEQMLLVRGIAWAELCINGAASASTNRRERGTPGGAPVSTAAAAFAQIASVDQWALLRFLALESSDAALEEYLAYETVTD